MAVFHLKLYDSVMRLLNMTEMLELGGVGIMSLKKYSPCTSVVYVVSLRCKFANGLKILK